jgi:hypothetical protein
VALFDNDYPGHYDDNALDQASLRLDAIRDTVEWYFTLADTPIARAPGDTGTPVAKVGTIASRLVSFDPPEKQTLSLDVPPTDACHRSESRSR